MVTVLKRADKIGAEDWVMGYFDINLLEIELGKAMDEHGFDEDLVQRTLFIKSNYSKAQRQTITLQDFS